MIYPDLSRQNMWRQAFSDWVTFDFKLNRLMHLIVKCSCRETSALESDVLSKRRGWELISFTRMVSVYIMSKHYGLKNRQIGAFMKRNQSNSYYSIKHIQDLIDSGTKMFGKPVSRTIENITKAVEKQNKDV